MSIFFFFKRRRRNRSFLCVGTRGLSPPTLRGARTGPRRRHCSRHSRPHPWAPVPDASARPSGASARADSARRETCRPAPRSRSEEHTSELQSQSNLVCRLLLEKKKKNNKYNNKKKTKTTQ